MSEQSQLHFQPLGWIQTTLGELIIILRGVSYPKSDALENPREGYVPILRANNIQESVLFKNLVYVPLQYVKPEQFLQFGDIIVAASSGSRHLVGKAAQLLSHWRGSFGTFCYALRPFAAINHRFVGLFLLTPEYRERISDLSSGININNLKQEHILGIPCPLPPLAEQQRIVDEIEKQFSRLDAAVEMLQRVERNLERLRAATLTAAVEGRLVPTEAEVARAEGRDYEPADVLLQRILRERRAKWEADQLAKMKEQGKTPNDDKWKANYEEPESPDTTDRPEMPEGWVLTTLKSITEIKGGITKGQQRRSGDVLRTVPYLRVANVQRGYLDLREIKTIEATEAEIEQLKLLPADILFTEGGDRDKLGRGWIWQNEIPECIHQNHVFRARLYLDQIHSKYISWYGNTYGQDYFAKQGKQTTNLASINITKLGAFPIPIPPAAEQSRIVAEVERRLSLIEELKTLVTNTLRRAAILRQKILRDAFAGKLVPQDPADEPASLLLERIRAEKAQRAAEAAKANKGSRRKSETRHLSDEVDGPQARACRRGS